MINTGEKVAIQEATAVSPQGARETFFLDGSALNGKVGIEAFSEIYMIISNGRQVTREVASRTFMTLKTA